MGKYTFSPAMVAKMRHRKGLTQKTLSKLICVSQASLSLWEKGKKTPRASNIAALASALECSPARFFEDGG